MRQKILREPGGLGYPANVCLMCGEDAAEDSDTEIQKHLEFSLGTCGICNEMHQVTSPKEFGSPTFYTYANGAPARRVR